jgi:hypothetical protein
MLYTAVTALDTQIRAKRLRSAEFVTVNLLKSNSFCMYQQYQHSEIFHSAHTVIYTFCMYLATNGEFRPLRHPMISFITEIESVYCAVRTRALSGKVYVSSLKDKPIGTCSNR